MPRRSRLAILRYLIFQQTCDCIYRRVESLGRAFRRRPAAPRPRPAPANYPVRTHGAADGRSHGDLLSSRIRMAQANVSPGNYRVSSGRSMVLSGVNGDISFVDRENGRIPHPGITIFSVEAHIVLLQHWASLRRAFRLTR